MPGGVLDTVDRDIFLLLVLLDTSVQSSVIINEYPIICSWGGKGYRILPNFHVFSQCGCWIFHYCVQLFSFVFLMCSPSC